MSIKLKYSLIILSVTFLIMQGCGGKKETALLPKASGKAGDIMVVMDTVQWNGNIGDAIRNTFEIQVPGLPRQENLFKLRRIDPNAFNSVLKNTKNLIFAVTLDNNSSGSQIIKKYFTQESLDKIKKNDDLYVFTARDEFARGQTVMYLFGKDANSLTQNIQNNKRKLQAYFNNAENERLRNGLYNAKEIEGFENLLKEEHNMSMRIPFGYKMVINQPGFIWFRQINDESDKDIIISYKPFNNKNAFDQDQIIAHRDSIAKKHLFEDPEKSDSYIVTETNVPYIPVTSRQYNFNDKYAVETRGLWKTNNLSMGGPFIGYTLVDEELQRIYYIEGFIYSPGKNQREFVRELQVILNTFKVSSEL